MVRLSGEGLDDGRLEGGQVENGFEKLQGEAASRCFHAEKADEFKVSSIVL